jgi:LCP family protein required for cell wall assembly
MDACCAPAATDMSALTAPRAVFAADDCPRSPARCPRRGAAMTIYVDPAVHRPRRPADAPPPPQNPPGRSRPGWNRPSWSWNRPSWGRPGSGRPGGGGPKKPNKPGKTANGQKKRKRKDPAWAKACAIAGAVVMFMAVAAVAVPRILADWATSNIPKADLIPQGLQGTDISGAINFLMLGMDERNGSKDLIRADSIIILHVPADHKTAFLVSLPRDAQVKIPAFPDTGYRGGEDKINAAFAFGSMTRNMQGDDSTAGRQRGAALTIETINDLVPGGMKFNGAAIISFDGFKDILQAIGGVDLCVDVETHSIHFDNKGVYHTQEVPYAQGKVYKVGCQHFDAVSALDYSRQRHFDTGDYVRQRHQQQLLMAIFKKLFSGGTLTNPGKIAAIQKAAGQLLTMDLGSNSVLDWLFTLKTLDPKHVVMIKTNGGKITPGSIPGDEAFSPDSMTMLQSVHDDTMATFLGQHPDWVTADNAPKQS